MRVHWLLAGLRARQTLHEQRASSRCCEQAKCGLVGAGAGHGRGSGPRAPDLASETNRTERPISCEPHGRTKMPADYPSERLKPASKRLSSDQTGGGGGVGQPKQQL